MSKRTTAGVAATTMTLVSSIAAVYYWTHVQFTYDDYKNDPQGFGAIVGLSMVGSVVGLALLWTASLWLLLPRRALEATK